MRTKKEEEEEEYYFHKVDFIESQKSCFTQTKPLKKAALITTTSLPLDGPSFMQRASSWSAISAPLNLYPSGEQEKGNLKKFFVKRLLMTALDTAVNRNALRYSKTVLDSLFHAWDSGLHLLDCGIWIPDSNRQWDSLFLELNPGFPKPRVLESKSNNFPDSGNWTPSLGVIITSKASDISQAAFCYVKCSTS